MTKVAWEEMMNEDTPRYEQIVSLIEEFARTTAAKEGARALIKEVYDMGHKHGGAEVWYARSGYGRYDEERAKPYWTVQSSSGPDGFICKSYLYENGQLVKTLDGNIFDHLNAGGTVDTFENKTE